MIGQDRLKNKIYTSLETWQASGMGMEKGKIIQYILLNSLSFRAPGWHSWLII